MPVVNRKKRSSIKETLEFENNLVECTGFSFAKIDANPFIKMDGCTVNGNGDIFIDYIYTPPFKLHYIQCDREGCVQIINLGDVDPSVRM